jgi:predicted ATPase
MRVVLTGGSGAGKTTLLDALRARGFATVPEHEPRALLAAYPYHREVFAFPPWEAIYCNDAARDQSFEEATRVHRDVTRWYRRCGYEVVEVPRVAVFERCEHVLGRLGGEDF